MAKEKNRAIAIAGGGGGGEIKMKTIFNDEG
jgi:hypothetical protein